MFFLLLALCLEPTLSDVSAAASANGNIATEAVLNDITIVNTANQEQKGKYSNIMYQYELKDTLHDDEYHPGYDYHVIGMSVFVCTLLLAMMIVTQHVRNMVFTFHCNGPTNYGPLDVYEVANRFRQVSVFVH